MISSDKTNKVLIYLIRRGEVDYVDDAKCDPVYGRPLSRFGMYQAKVVGKKVRHLLPCTVLTSPFLRVVETVKLALPDVSFNTDDRLSEYAPTKTATGREYKEWKKKAMDNFVFIPPSGESMDMAAHRVRLALIEAGQKAEKNMLVFGHALSFGAFLKKEFTLDHFPVIEECSITKVRFYKKERKFELVRINSRTWNIHIFLVHVWRKMKTLHIRVF